MNPVLSTTLQTERLSRERHARRQRPGSHVQLCVPDRVLANEPLPQRRATADRAVAYLQEISAQERLRHAGVLCPASG